MKKAQARSPVGHFPEKLGLGDTDPVILFGFSLLTCPGNSTPAPGMQNEDLSAIRWWIHLDSYRGYCRRGKSAGTSTILMFFGKLYHCNLLGTAKHAINSRGPISVLISFLSYIKLFLFFETTTTFQLLISSTKAWGKPDNVTSILTTSKVQAKSYLEYFRDLLYKGTAKNVARGRRGYCQRL